MKNVTAITGCGEGVVQFDHDRASAKMPGCDLRISGDLLTLLADPRIGPDLLRDMLESRDELVAEVRD